MNSATFQVTFNNIKNISVKMGGNSINEEDEKDWVDVNITQPFSVTISSNDSFDGRRCFLFFGNSEDFVNTPSVSIKDKNGNIETVNAIKAYQFDPFKYYIFFGVNYSGSYDDDVPFIRGTEGYKYLNPINFTGETICNCGGLSESVNFYKNDFGLIGIYEVEKQAIQNIMQNNRYFLNKIEEQSNIVNILDYIKLLYKTHINIDSDLPPETIYINGVGVSTQGKPIDDYLIEFETENVKIQGYYNNVLDNDTEININIPYYGLYHLDSNFINHNVKLKFICDLMTNNSLCTIFIDNIIIDTVELKTGYEIPLKDLNINETQQRIYSVYNEECYITLKEKRIVNNRIDTVIQNTTINNEINNTNLSGFIRCDDIKLINNSINDYEKSLIINQLKEGVIL